MIACGHVQLDTRRSSVWGGYDLTSFSLGLTGNWDGCDGRISIALLIGPFFFGAGIAMPTRRGLRLPDIEDRERLR